LLEGINRDLAELMNGSVQYRGAGTTVAGVTVVDGRVIVFNVGDSRVYRKQEQLLELLTKDDRPLSLEPIPVGEGSRQSSTLLQCLGGNASYRAVSPHVVSVQAVPGDQFLLCTDGLTDVVSLDQMESTISATPMETVKKLRDLAFAAGAPDNVSIVMLQLH
jgi:serine/threonine protein phosphatase PrpC